MRRKLWILLVLCMAATATARAAQALRFCLRSEPKTFNPLLVDDDASETIRYLTGGVLLRVNRQTQALEPELATAWKLGKDGRTITFTLRAGLYFSDGTPFTAEDVAATVQQLMDPALHSPTGDTFRSGEGKVATAVSGNDRVTIAFPAPVAGLDRLFDQVAILSAHSPHKEMAVLGPYYVADRKPGNYVLLKRNPNYWKRDAAGRQLPYIDEIWLEVQPNRDLEMLRFKNGEIQLINALDSEYYDRLAAVNPSAVHDAGPSLDSEQMWFNQAARAPLPAYKLAWFRSQTFRRAVSEAIDRQDMARIVFGNHARPAVGPISPANKLWFNPKLQAIPYDPAGALRQLEQAGFRLQKDVLTDSQGHPVEFSMITNSGNKFRERMAAMIQQDLAKIGIRVNLVTLDFPSLIERMTESFNYEAALLGLTNVEPDPSSQMNVWLSSGDNHAWNPRQKSPETAWEAEIDRLVRAQAQSAAFQDRKRAFDRVQEIVADQAPFLYLVNQNALSAISPGVHGAVPVVLRPQTYWNVEQWTIGGGPNGAGK
jgi:peptide/nickel transport system substrate-binding protein